MIRKQVANILSRSIKCFERPSSNNRHIRYPVVLWNRNTFYHNLQRNVAKCNDVAYNLQPYRNKYSKNQSQSREGNSDSDEDEVQELDDGISDKSSKVMLVRVGSLRVDLLLKAGLQMARNKVEAVFYQSKIRVNGKKIFKKSAQLSDGDEVDVIRGFSHMNPDFVVVSRLEILSVTEKGEDYAVKLRRFKTLVIENYTDPWRQNQTQE